MIIVWRVERTPLRQANVVIDCPSCKRQAAAAVAFDELHTTIIYFVLPILWNTVSFVRCNVCKREFPTKDPVGVLKLLSRQDLTEVLNRRETGLAVYKFCILVSLVLFCVPVVALIMGLIGLSGVYNSQSKWKIAAFVGVGLSSLSTLWMLVTMLVVSIKHY